MRKNKSDLSVSGNITIEGTPTDPNHAATKDYVDSNTPASGLPVGGTTGQVLGKTTNADYDVSWINQTGGGGEALVASGTFATSTGVDIDGCFTSASSEYKIVVIISDITANTDIRFRLRAAGSPETSAIYRSARLYWDSTFGPLKENVSNGTSWEAASANATTKGAGAVIELIAPAEASATYYFASDASTSATEFANITHGAVLNTTAYDGFSLLPLNGTSGMTGEYRVYKVNTSGGVTGPVGPSGGPVPAGGTDGQIVVKDGVAEGAVRWDGEWITYTPTVGGTITQGNGTCTGSWIQHGKIVYFRAVFTRGSTTTYGGSIGTITLPKPLVAQLQDPMVRLHDNGSAYYMGGGSWSSTYVDIYTLGASGLFGAITNTAPFTWTTGDQIFVSGSYIA